MNIFGGTSTQIDLVGLMNVCAKNDAFSTICNIFSPFSYTITNEFRFLGSDFFFLKSGNVYCTLISTKKKRFTINKFTNKSKQIKSIQNPKCLERKSKNKCPPSPTHFQHSHPTPRSNGKHQHPKQQQPKPSEYLG